MLQKIGTRSENLKRYAFENQLKDLAPQTQKPFVDAITDLDVSNEKTFEGGCKFLCDWYRSKCIDTATFKKEKGSQFKFKYQGIPLKILHEFLCL